MTMICTLDVRTRSGGYRATMDPDTVAEAVLEAVSSGPLPRDITITTWDADVPTDDGDRF